MLETQQQRGYVKLEDLTEEEIRKKASQYASRDWHVVESTLDAAGMTYDKQTLINALVVVKYKQIKDKISRRASQAGDFSAVFKLEQEAEAQQDA